MSLPDDHHHEMQTQPLLDDQTIESILAGRNPSGRRELDELASFVSEVRSVATAPAPKVGAELAAVLAGGLTTDKGDLSATAASNVTGPAKQAAGLPKRRKSMLETIFAKAALAKAAAVLGGLTIATTGAAAADLLPGAAQNGVATVIEAVSPLNLPDSDDKRSGADYRSDDVADHKPEVPAGQEPQVPAGQSSPNAENLGADISERARSTEEKGKDFGQDVSRDARNRYQPPAAGTQQPAPPASTPTGSNNPGTKYRDNAPSHQPSQTPTADSNPGSGYRR